MPPSHDGCSYNGEPDPQARRQKAGSGPWPLPEPVRGLSQQHHSSRGAWLGLGRKRLTWYHPQQRCTLSDWEPVLRRRLRRARTTWGKRLWLLWPLLRLAPPTTFPNWRTQWSGGGGGEGFLSWLEVGPLAPKFKAVVNRQVWRVHQFSWVARGVLARHRSRRWGLVRYGKLLAHLSVGIG
jgi:hypothetical protein